MCGGGNVRGDLGSVKHLIGMNVNNERLFPEP